MEKEGNAPALPEIHSKHLPVTASHPDLQINEQSLQLVLPSSS